MNAFDKLSKDKQKVLITTLTNNAQLDPTFLEHLILNYAKIMSIEEIEYTI